MASKKCPHCNKGFNIPSVAYRNCEAYYNYNSYHIKCDKCGNMVDVYLERVVFCRGLEKSTHTQESF